MASLTQGTKRRGPGGRAPILGTPKGTLSKALEWACFHRGPFWETRRDALFLGLLDKEMYQEICKMHCKRVSLSIGAPLGNLEGIRLPRLFERIGKYIWVPFLDPEKIKIFKSGAIWNVGKRAGQC